MCITLVMGSFVLPNSDFVHSVEIIIRNNFNITISILLKLLKLTSVNSFNMFCMLIKITFDSTIF